MAHLSRVSITCRKCIQEQQFQPVEFTATAEITFTAEDTPSTIERGCAQIRRKAIAVVEEGFNQWLNAGGNQCETSEKP